MKALVLFLAAALVTAGAPAIAGDREPAFAGRFYPGDAKRLEAAVRGYLAGASAPRAGGVVAFVAPHAGYAYCGRIIGEAFRQVQGETYDVIVLLGTNHTRAGLSKAAVWNEGSWRTPLGPVKVDAEVADALLASGSDCLVDPYAHTSEHSIEVLLPFVQTVFPGVPIVPVVVGSPETAFCERLGGKIAAAAGARRALVVASTDLSHYPSAADARAVDRATLEAMVTMDGATFCRAVREPERRGVPELVTCACGEAPAAAAMAAAKALGAARGTLVAYANSGDVPEGDTARAVGYGAVVFTRDEADDPARTAGAERAASAAPAQGLSRAAKGALLVHARRCLETYFATGKMLPAAGCEAAPSMKRGAFVTLKKHGELRGCIGHIAVDLPLCECVGRMALEAALHDSRFPPLERDELPRTEIEISVLTPALPVSGPDAIVVGRDGVILRKGGRSAVFLPQVALEQGWDRETMLSNLARKAGLPADAWRSGAEFLTFQAEVFSEADAGR